jgi:transcriptional regulator with XRE-family HTH domain
MNRLQERRLELGLTLPEVSQRLKAADSRMDVGMVSRFERGACLPTPEVLTALEEVLQAPRTTLFGEDELRALEDIDATDGLCELTVETRALLCFIPVGRENAISRAALCAAMNVPDRRARELIERARRSGVIICNSGDGRGYYRTDDIDEIEREYRGERSRALSVLSRLKRMRAILKDAGRAV